MSKAEFERLFPGMFFLSPEAPDEIGAFLRDRNLIGPSEAIRSVTRAGAGNMNCVLRVVTDEQSLIVKQSRPWVEKFPSIAAPRTRVRGEARFYTAIAHHEHVAEKMPRLLAHDSFACVIVLEDLGQSKDFTYLYNANESLGLDVADELCDWLSQLHGIDNGVDRHLFENREMRLLNHEHIFRFPLDGNNGLQLDQITSGLGECAKSLQQDAAYVEAVESLGEVYLGQGDCLLHGDFFPGSWLRQTAGVRVIDPEFSFYGRPEFELGVLLAHMRLSEQSLDVDQLIRTAYRPGGEFHWGLADQFAGVEIMRRLIGVAQLPLVMNLKRKRELLQLSRELVSRDRAV